MEHRAWLKGRAAPAAQPQAPAQVPTPLEPPAQQGVSRQPHLPPIPKPSLAGQRPLQDQLHLCPCLSECWSLPLMGSGLWLWTCIPWSSQRAAGARPTPPVQQSRRMCMSTWPHQQLPSLHALLLLARQSARLDAHACTACWCLALQTAPTACMASGGACTPASCTSGDDTCTRPP